MKKLYGWAWIGLLIVCCLAVPGYAEEQQEFTLEAMTVTAQKRKENVQNVPVSISAFSHEALYDAGIDELSDIARFSPNVYMYSGSMVIRGVSQYYGAKTSSVGFYLDGVSLPFEGVFSSELFDIERIEVLKGPQGTLYGKNSEAGVVNIITKQPGNEFSAKISGEYSYYDTKFGRSPSYYTGGNINVPVINDKLFLRLSGKFEDDKGYVKNVYNGDEEAGEDKNYNGRLNLKWISHDRWDVSLIADTMNMDYSHAYFNATRDKVSYDGPYSGEKEGNGQTLRIKYAADGYDLLSITSHRRAKNDQAYDFDMTSDPSSAMETTIVDESTSYSQEIRLSSADETSPFQWLTGVYAFDEEMDIYQQKVFPASTTTRNTNSDSFGYAVFGQGTYTFIERLHLTAGLRYDYTDFEAEQDLTTLTSETVYGKDFDNGEVLPKLSAAYDFSSNIMGYTSVAKGYLTGGYNFKWATNADNLTYEPEYTWNYEVGIKSTWYDKRLIANVSAFYIDMKDKQVAEWDTNSAVGRVTRVRNAANAYSTGVECSLQARLAPGLDLFAGVGYLRARIDDWVAWEYDSTTGGGYQYDYKDKHLPNVPECTYNLGVQYRHLSGFFGRIDWLGTGSMYSDAKNDTKLDGYQLVNLRIGFETEKYDIQVWSKNFFDKDYSKTQSMEGEPRMFGLTVNYRF